jgi:hypothetical protein
MIKKPSKPTNLATFQISGADLKPAPQADSAPSRFNRLISRDSFAVTGCDLKPGSTVR